MPTRMPHGFWRLTGPRAGRPSWLDVTLALALLGLSLPHARDSWLDSALAAAVVAPLLWRRRAPVVVFAVIWVVAAVQWLAAGALFADAALLIAFYTVAAERGLRMAVIAGAALELAVVLAITQRGGGTDVWLRSFVGLSGLATAAGVLGINVGHRRQTLAGLRERAERLEREREQELQLATAGERARIAREMHDVVAHNLSVMVALCDGAAYHVDEAPDRVRSALEQASRTGRQALAEMRQLLGVLREPPVSPELAPQPGIRQIGELVEQIRAAGMSASYAVTGEATGAPAGMELAIYRIVQEALTNTLKHAGGGASVAVTLSCAADEIAVEVRDTGNVPHRPSADGAGLRGMRERAAVYGGSLEAGPCDPVGWRVRTSLSIPARALVAAR